MKKVLLTLVLGASAVAGAQTTNCYWRTYGYQCNTTPPPATYSNPYQNQWNDLNNRMAEQNRQMQERNYQQQQEMNRQAQESYRQQQLERLYNRPQCTTYTHDMAGNLVARTAPCAF